MAAVLLVLVSDASAGGGGGGDFSGSKVANGVVSGEVAVPRKRLAAVVDASAAPSLASCSNLTPTLADPPLVGGLLGILANGPFTQNTKERPTQQQ